MATTASTTDMTPGYVADKLRSLRRSVATWIVVEGSSRLLLVLGTVVAFDLLIDWYFRMDVAQRGVCLGLMGVTAAWALFRFLVRPLARPITDNMLILQVEKKHSELAQSLISAVQFAHINDRIESLGLSSHMVEATIRRGTNAARDVDFCDVLDQRRYMRNLMFCICVVLGTAGFALAAPDVAETWARRNLLLGSAQWPQDTHLRIVQLEEGADSITLPRGDDLLLQVDIIKGLVPSIVEVEFRSSGSGSGIQQMTRRDNRSTVVAETMVAEDDPNKPRFEFTFKNVLDEFELRVEGGDARTPWTKVRLVERPVVAKLSLHVTPPKYIGDEPFALRREEGIHNVYRGSSLMITGQATRRLVSARLRIVAKDEDPLDLEMQVDPNSPKSFSINVEPKDLKAAIYKIEVIDQQGRRSKRPEDFVIRIRRDRAPSVRSRLKGISSMIVAKARIPIASAIEDDLAISSAKLVYRKRPPSSAAADNNDKEAQKPTAKPKLESIAFDQIEDDLGKRKIKFTYKLDARSLRLTVGTIVEFHVEAADNNVVSGPSVGKSHLFQLRVVTEEELRSDLLRREKEQRRQFEDLSITQSDLLTEVGAMAADLVGDVEMTTAQRDKLLKIQKRQSQASQRCEMIAGWLENISLEVANNRLEDAQGRYQTTMQQKIIQPMRRLAKLDIPKAAQLLGDVRRIGNDDRDARRKLLAETVRTQRQITTTMVDILGHMAKSEGFQEVINILHRTIGLQNGVHRATKDRIGGGDEPSDDNRDKHKRK